MEDVVGTTIGIRTHIGSDIIDINVNVNININININIISTGLFIYRRRSQTLNQGSPLKDVSKNNLCCQINASTRRDDGRIGRNARSLGWDTEMCHSRDPYLEHIAFYNVLTDQIGGKGHRIFIHIRNNGDQVVTHKLIQYCIESTDRYKVQELCHRR